MSTILSNGGIYLGKHASGDATLLLKYANRHGLIAGATGTGKTITLQGIAEGFSQAGVPVFIADVKGDLSGLAAAGAAVAVIRLPELCPGPDIGVGIAVVDALPDLQPGREPFSQLVAPAPIVHLDQGLGRTRRPAEEGVGVALDDNNKALVSPEMLAAVDKAKADIISGALQVHDYMSDEKCPY